MRGALVKAVVFAVVVVAAGGCVERTLTITSEPTGALVYVSSVEVGRTPVMMPFTWYGDYDIILRRDGYKTLKTHHRVRPPIYEIPPLDLLSEMAPWTYHVKRSVHFTLAKATHAPDADLIRRAEALRRKCLEGVEK